MTLQDLLDEHGIQHFAAFELHSRSVRGGAKNVEAPQELWPNIIPVLKIADIIRERIEGPLTVISAYRTPEYNALRGNKPTSMHCQFRAIDLTSRYAPISELWRIASEEMDHAYARGITTGRGLYDTFCHIDVGHPTKALRRWDARSRK